MVPTEDEARVSDTHTSDRRARVRRVLERMRARLLAAIVHRMCINVYHRYFVPEKRQNERYFVSRIAPRVPRGCCATAFLSAPCAFFFKVAPARRCLRLQDTLSTGWTTAHKEK